jgi:hypothetical protein
MESNRKECLLRKTEYDGDTCPACVENKEKAKEDIKLNHKKNKYIFAIFIFIFVIIAGTAFLVWNYSKPSADEQLKSTVITISQQAVEKKLKAPSTAKFPFEYDNYVIYKNGDTYTVSSYVDAENSFGAKIRSNFTVELVYHSDKEEYKINSVVVE